MIDSTLVLMGTLPNTGAAVTASAATTNVLDNLTARDIGAGDDIYVTVLITETFLTLTSLTFEIQTSADNSSFVDVLRSPAIVAADLLAGQSLTYVLPKKQLNDPIGGTPNQYLRGHFTVAGSNATAGKVIVWVGAAPDQPAFVGYPAGYTATTVGVP